MTGPVSGRIDLVGAEIDIRDGSVVLAQQFDDRVPDFPNSGLFLRGDRAISIAGIAADGRLPTRISSEALQGQRRGGDIAIRTPELTVSQGASIASRSFGAGRSGDLSIETNSVQLLDANARIPNYFSSVTTSTFGAGQAGSLNVTTDRLFSRNGGTIASSTFGLGDGGDVRVMAHDRIDLVGIESQPFAPSTILASSFGFGNAGNLDVSAPDIAMRLGGRIDASTFNAGNAGTVTVRADRLTMTGTTPLAQDSSAILSSANILEPTLRALLNTPDRPTGDAGGVRLFVDRLDIQTSATVAVRNQGTGDGGRLEIAAGELRLSDRGSLSAITESGEGSNIRLDIRDSLQLRQQGAISATAGGTGNGGNIDITSATIVALENSDITANAIAGRGGNVTLSTQGLFGTTFRNGLTPNSDITASSNFGIAGNVRLETPKLDTSQAAVVLSTQTLTGETIVQTECRDLRRGRFALLGRSGLPIDPAGGFPLMMPPLTRAGLQAGSSLYIGVGADADVNVDPVEAHAPIDWDSDRSAAVPIESDGWTIATDGTIALVGQGRAAIGGDCNE